MLKPTCFLIDDDDDDRYIFQVALSEIDNCYTCLSASDGVAAVEQLSGSPVMPDFIFLDVNMPRMSGHECLIRLREIPHLVQTPIFIYTTSVNKKEHSWFLKNGASGVLIKPTSMMSLVTMLKEIVSGSAHAAAAAT
jgi:CheY-like chemotaxis protein